MSSIDVEQAQISCHEDYNRNTDFDAACHHKHADECFHAGK